jgi:hypothetical protein
MKVLIVYKDNGYEGLQDINVYEKPVSEGTIDLLSWVFDQMLDSTLKFRTEEVDEENEI